MRLGLFFDVSNLYHCLYKKYGKRLSYYKFMEWVKDLGDVSVARAYGSAIDNNANSFIRALQKMGIETFYKSPKDYDPNNPDHSSGAVRRKANWDVGIAIDAIMLADEFDTLILCTSNGDMAPLVAWAKAEGKTVIVIASSISDDLKEAANDYIELPESLLQEDLKR